MPVFNVTLLESQHDDELVCFLDKTGRKTPSVLAYHYPFYRNMLVAIGMGRPFYLAARLGGKIVAVLPGFVKEENGWSTYCSLPFFGPNAGVVCADHSDELYAGLLKGLIGMIEQIPSILSASLYTPFLFENFSLYEKNLPPALVTPKFTQFLSLLDLGGWSKGIRYDLRKAYRAGLEISEEISPQGFDEFFKIYQQNCAEQGIMQKPKQLVKELVFGQAGKDHVRCLFAYLRGHLVAGLIVLISQLTASYYLPCTLESARALQPGTALIDRLIFECRQSGLQYWNWESSPTRESGVYHFKKKWGALESCYRIYTVPFQDKTIYQSYGVENLKRHFQYYFVYPFNQL